MKYNKALILILIISAGLRLWKVGVIPQGVTNDEMGYIYNAYSISATGKNIFGEFLPLFTWVNSGGFPFMPVPTYFLIPFFWLFGLSPTIGRLPSAILGVLDVALLFIIVKQLFNNMKLALLSSFFLAISAWHLHFTRSAYDHNFGLFFYLLALCLFLYEVKNKKIPIFSLLSFFLAIYSYRGMNVIFIPLIIMLAWYAKSELNISKKQLTSFLAGVGIILLSLFAVILIFGNKYTAEGQFYKDPKMQEFLDTQIREAQGPLKIRRMFLNKPMYIAHKLGENYIKGYSPEFLFLYTEPNKIYSIWSRGRIYFIDIVFIIFGAAFLLKLNKKAGWFVIGLLVIGGLPGMVGGMPYSARNFFLSAIFPIFIAGGVLCIVDLNKKKAYKIFVITLITISYSYVFGSYLFDYYGRYAYQAAEPWYKSLKEISQTIEDKKSSNLIIVGTSSFPDLLQYAFYTKMNPFFVQESWLKSKDSESFNIDSILFTRDCSQSWVIKKSSERTIIIVHDDCLKDATPSARVRDYFGNTVWKIYENL